MRKARLRICSRVSLMNRQMMRKSSRAKLIIKSLHSFLQKDEEVFCMEEMLERSCGLDVHKEMIEGCILIKAGTATEVYHERFGCTPAELKKLCEWVQEHNVRNIAMESTGVYWMPIYEALETECPEGTDILVGNAYHMKNVPGRKSDTKDAEWIAELLMKGLLQHSFVPDRYMRDVREISRARRKLIRERVTEINHVEKYLQAHGIKLSSVLSTIICETGMNILEEFCRKGEITLKEIEKCRRGNLKHTTEEMYEALCVKLTKAETKMLSFQMERIKRLDKDEETLNAMLEELMEQYSDKIGTAVSIPGLQVVSAIEIIAEIGNDPVATFKTKERLCKWAGLSPRNDGSAGEISKRRTLHSNPYIKSLLVQCAWASVKSRKSQMHEWFWRKQSLIGRKKAIVAVARKILALLFTLFKNGEVYKEPEIAT